MGFPGGSVVKNLPANSGDVGSVPGSERSPGEGNGNPLQYSRLENPMDRGGLPSVGLQRIKHDLVIKEQQQQQFNKWNLLLSSSSSYLFREVPCAEGYAGVSPHFAMDVASIAAHCIPLRHIFPCLPSLFSFILTIVDLCRLNKVLTFYSYLRGPIIS